MFFAFSRVPTLLSWLRSALFTPSGRGKKYCWFQFFSGIWSPLAFFISYFFQSPIFATRICWWSGVALDHVTFLVPRIFFALRKSNLTREVLPINLDWTKERYLQMLVIGVGEIIAVSVSYQLSNSSNSIYRYGIVACVVLIGAAFFAVFFFAEASVWQEQHALLFSASGTCWVWLHLPVLYCVVFSSAMMETLTDHLHLPLDKRLIFVGSIVLFLVVISLLSFTSHGSSMLLKIARALLRVSVFAAVGLGICFVEMDALLFLFIICLCLYVLIVIELTLKRCFLPKSNSAHHTDSEVLVNALGHPDEDSD